MFSDELAMEERSDIVVGVVSLLGNTILMLTSIHRGNAAKSADGRTPSGSKFAIFTAREIFVSQFG